MKPKYFKISLWKHAQISGQTERCFYIEDEHKKPTHMSGHAIVVSARTQNELRAMLKAFRKYHVSAPLSEFVVCWDDFLKEFRLWVDCRYWPGRAAWYAGIIYAHQVNMRRKRKLKRRRAQHS